MDLGKQIKHYRKHAGLTQEQVATALGVSTPAVNKWEKGSTCPDIALIPALARLLKIDLNELFSFHEQLTEPEVSQFVNELSAAALKGFAGAFAMAAEKIQEYPHCDLLLYEAATILNSFLALSDLEEENKREYSAAIRSWFEEAADSSDEKIKTSSIFMLAVQYVQMKEYEKAGALLDQLPDTALDATVMKANVLAHQKGPDAAALFLEGNLMKTLTNVQGYLYKLIELEQETGNPGKAEAIADIAGGMVSLFGLWGYGKFSPHLLIALHQKDAEKCVFLIKKALHEAQKPWDFTASPLYYRFAGTALQSGFSGVGDSFIRTLASEIETQEAYEFLRGNKELQSLFAEYIQ